MESPKVYLPLLRGTTEGADCPNCPFSVNGEPHKPVVSEFPENPAWLVIGEGPGHNEVRIGRPFVGMSGDVVNKVLAKIGRDRRDLYVGNATCCIPPKDTPEQIRMKAAEACRPRLLRELAMFPQKPVLTLGAVAARSIIPQPILDAIDPPEQGKAVRKAQKLRQAPMLKDQISRRRAIDKITQKRLKKKISEVRKRIIVTTKVKYKKRPDESYLQREVNAVHAQLLLKSREEAIAEYELKKKEREVKKLLKAEENKHKKPKHKKIKITDIVGTLFDVDVDSSGVRPLIPAIHPAALLRGGGASIGGSHTPDMGFINLIYDAAKIDSLAKGKDIRLKLDVHYEVTDQQRAIELFLRVYREALAEGAASLDLETYVDDPDRHHALMAYVAKIRVIGIATSKFTVSLAWDLLPLWCHSLLQTLFAQVVCCFHNGLYDRTVLRARGFILPGDSWDNKVQRWDDTLLAHHAAFPGNSHRLQFVGAQFFGVGPWKSEFRNQEETPEQLAIYNAKDTGVTHALRAPLHVWIKRRDVNQVYQLDKKMSDVASRMHLAGMPVHRETNTELLNTFSKNVAESKRAVEDVARDPKLREQIFHHLSLTQAAKKRKLDPDDFEERYKIRLSAMKLDPDWKWKISAGKHIAALLLAMGVGLYQTTAGGDPSTNKEVLESLTDVAIVRDILAFRENDKLLSTFIWQIFDRFAADGTILQYGYADELDRIHPVWNVHRITGRWASAWPVVSNVPKDKWKKLTTEEVARINVELMAKLMENAGKPVLSPSGVFFRFSTKDKSISKMTRPNLRRQIRCRPGRKFVGFDFGQIEARVIALISGDPFLCAIFAEGRDPHIECARIIWPNFDSLDKDTQKQLRENVKNIEYGAMYMAQLETLHKTMLKAGNMIKLKDLAVAIAKLLDAMAGVVKWQHATIAKASQPPYEIKDFILGRTRVWPMGQAEGPEAVNYGVQTAAAALMNTGMARMAEKLENYNEVVPVGQFHDAALFECWDDDAERLGRDVKLSFETEVERDGRKIPFPIDLKIADTWAEA